MQYVWTWLNGKKTALGMTAMIILAWLDAQGVFPGDMYQTLVLPLLSAWGVLGVGHKALKGVKK